MDRALSLSELAGTDGVENVVVFVSDALRYDFLPAEVRERGVTGAAIAPSTFTASSLPSLTTGKYPASHEVWMFDDRLSTRPELLTPDGVEVGFDAEGVWVELPERHKPPLQMHRLESETKLADLVPPFAHVVHDVGPHAPYGFENGVFDSTREFFSDHERRRRRLIELYREDCHNSAQRFLNIYDQLAARGLLEETLLVFTSDHGQCLGERRNGGRFGHGHPMSPEAVEIPIVFMGAGLPAGESFGRLLSGTDIETTLLSAQRGRAPPDADGVDVWRNVPPADRRLRSEIWQHLDVDVAGMSGTVSVYAATSAWNDTGGYVFHRKSRLQRAAAIAYDNLRRGYSPAWIHNATLGDGLKLAGIVLSEKLTYGSPDFSEDEARATVPDEFAERAGGEGDVELSEQQESQLRDLGYLQ
jgi:arylsulfatase A-like enzyme